MRRDDGVSEAIGFILIFSIVVIGIAIVILYGLPLIIAGQGSADMRNMEQTMIVLQNDQKSLSYKMVPYKETALQVSGGTLHVTGVSGVFTVSYSDPDGVLRTLPSYEPGQIRYTSDLDRSRVAIENGAVVTRPGFAPGSAMLAEPRWYVDDHQTVTLIISFISFDTDRDRTLAGVGRLGMKSVSAKLNTTEYQVFPGTIEIGYTPHPEEDYSVAWENYLIGRLGMHSTGADSYRHPNAARLIVKETVIQISGF
ncbi:MAG: hypothetical protein D5R99_02310 [Methanocalculus sp. MSAO_Arc1]|uniref:DUF7289 family protein n=1 Tax=Methanocalculus TaxID=71151 RepID=UPI000FF0D7C3|nr:MULTISPECIES: hypothetical protein [unclassified Methanocalculus]MCP1661682.1 hypothetical protein [Methanocalculus sp. AMF5]RQD81426.1 MAG: hypothetical protein D5R99_02310 [Methanocalculus sp. MSAO_Arc1]